MEKYIIQYTHINAENSDLKLNKPHDLNVGNTEITKFKPENITTEEKSNEIHQEEAIDFNKEC